MTRAPKLAKVLKVCRKGKESTKRRRLCESRAQKRYGAKGKKSDERGK